MPCGTLLAGTETFPLSPLFCSTMLSSPTPGSPTGATAQFFPAGNSLRLGSKDSALPSHRPLWVFLALTRPWWVNFTRLNRFAHATAWWIACLLDGPTWDFSRPPRRLLLSFRPTSHLLRASGITTAPTGQSALAELTRKNNGLLGRTLPQLTLKDAQLVAQNEQFEPERRFRPASIHKGTQHQSEE